MAAQEQTPNTNQTAPVSGGAAQPIKEAALKIKPRKKPKWIAPEVIQTSAMDCGPASLKSLLEGFGINVSYGRLREACQTDVDGTSIDTMEEIAVQLGLNAEQTVIPLDHIFLKPSNALPAIVVIRQPNGTTHFVVAWRAVGGFIQLMDPATGRRWVSPEKFAEDLYIHTAVIPAEAWHGWSKEEEFTSCLRERMLSITKDKARVNQLIEKAKGEDKWIVMAALDAATRMTDAIVEADGLDRGTQAAKVLESIWVQAIQDESAIPLEYWSARTAPPDGEGAEQVYLTGAVLVRILGPQTEEEVEVATSINTEEGLEEEEPEEGGVKPLSAELERALREPPARPWREMISFLREDGFLAPFALLFALFASSIGLTIEALLLRGFLDVSAKLQLPEQRLGAMGVFLLFALALLLLEIPLSLGFLRIGRRLETRLRIAFLEKLPKLGDRYFRSRLTSDMTDRIHSVHQLKSFPQLGSNFLRSCFELVLTTTGLIWLSPGSAPIALAVAAMSIAMPLLTQPFLTERDLKVRSQGGAISRFYLDALLGLVAVRTHGAERALRREHEGLLVEWSQASVSRLMASTTIEGLQAFLGLGLSAAMLMQHLGSGGQIGGALLLFYWSLSLPNLGQEITQIARQYPAYRNVTLRLLEPLGAPEEAENDALFITDTQQAEEPEDSTSTLPESLGRIDSGAFRTVFSALGDEASRTKSVGGITTVSSNSKTRFKAVKYQSHPDNAPGRAPSSQNLAAVIPSNPGLPALPSSRYPAIGRTPIPAAPVSAPHPSEDPLAKTISEEPGRLSSLRQSLSANVDPLMKTIPDEGVRFSSLAPPSPPSQPKPIKPQIDQGFEFIDPVTLQPIKSGNGADGSQEPVASSQGRGGKQAESATQSKPQMDSRLRGNDGVGMDSRLRGNDVGRGGNDVGRGGNDGVRGGNDGVRGADGEGRVEQKGNSPEGFVSNSPGVQPQAVSGVSIRMRNVTVRAGGHTILQGINVSIAPKSHIAVVGSSGAGKSSLVGLLLGWFKPSSGRVFVDNELLIGSRLEKLRQETAWVDPAVQLWNRSILDNLCYGTSVAPTIPIGEVLEQADLRQVLERFPDGLKTKLGESGALVSGGEGQRVRFGRALVRPDVRLAILDEPFRGLDREKRRELLTRARLYWSMATLICITHDVGETRAFERVLVIEGGKIVEDGVPEALAAMPSSRYRQLLDAEDEVRHKLWAASSWRKIRIAQGKITEVTSSKRGQS